MRNFLELLKRFRSDEGGAFFVIFGLLAVVLIATAGAVVDFTTIEQARTRAQDALDSAALGLQSTIYDAGVTEETIKAKAQALVVERLADANVTATVSQVNIDKDTGMLRLRASVDVPTAFVALVGIDHVTAGVVAEARRGSVNLEIALALDVTISMDEGNPSRIASLKEAATAFINLVVRDVQTPTYSKVALVPWASSVNVGSLAAQLRGSVNSSYSTITGAVWRETPTTRTISAISKENPTKITTSTNHGLSTGAVIYLSGINGGSSFTALNNRWYRITVTSNTQFTLTGISTSGVSGSYTFNSGTVTIWPSARMASTISKANPGVVTTTANHGLATGDAVYITDAAGGGFTALNGTTSNGKWYRVTRVNDTQFRLDSTNTSSYSGTYTANSAIIRKCLTNECEVVVTSANHGFANGDYVYVTNVGGMTQINEQYAPPYEVSDRTNNTLVLEDSNGVRTSAYTSGGRLYCTKGPTVTPACEYYSFVNKSNSRVVHRITDCVTERVIANKYTDVAPSTTLLGRHYRPIPSGFQDCATREVFPLSDNKADLIAEITALTTTGSTAGQIGTAWGWYMVSPNFAYLFTDPKQKPAAYDAPHTKKIVVIMTDGDYNTPYYNGVLAKDQTIPGGTSYNSQTINQDSQNGNPFTQARSLCTAMKTAGVTVYTVGFAVSNNATIVSMLTDCASTPENAYLADNGATLIGSFRAIGNSISNLRLAQ